MKASETERKLLYAELVLDVLEEMGSRADEEIVFELANLAERLGLGDVGESELFRVIEGL